MESPHETYRSISKRKPIEDNSSSACKTPRISVECGPSCAHCCQRCNMKPNPADKYLSFLNSRVPRRIMFYNYGEWLDFPDQVKQNLIISFKNEKSCSKMTMCGQLILVDLLSMTMVNLRTKKQHSVAWIDEADKCFFPNCFSDGKADEYNELSCNVMNRRPKEPLGPPEVVKHVIMEKGTTVSQKHTRTEILKKRIENVPRDSRDFLFVQNIFLSGMRHFATAENILHIHRYVQKDFSSRIALEAFETQIRATRAECGDANVRYGWFGLTKLQIASILIHGFSTVLKPAEGVEVDNCIHLSPDDRAFASVNICDVDEKGVQYMMLCRIILGKPKEVLPGSDDYFYNSKCGSDMDDDSSPRFYKVWPSQARSHIHPEYIVAFKLHQNVREYLFGLNNKLFDLKPRGNMQKFSTLHHTSLESVKGPNSPWLSLTVLFAEIEDKISPTAKDLLYRHYGELKRKMMTREDLIKKMREIIGDKLLLAAFMKHKRDTSSWYGDSALNSRFGNSVELKSETVVPDDTTESSSSPAKTFFGDTKVPNMVAGNSTISKVVSSDSFTLCQSPDNLCGSSRMFPNVIASSERVHVVTAASRTEHDNVRAVKLETDELAELVPESNGNKSKVVKE